MMRQTTSLEDVYTYLAEQIEKKVQVLLRTLTYIGKECVKNARTNPGYIDQTGNLRSSIGFMVLRDGVVVHKGGFEKVRGGTKGLAAGREFMSELVAENDRGLVLILVAGMNYATYVEATGRNVLKSGELQAEVLIPQLLKQLGFKTT
jgi:hypothetical protein